MTGLDVDSSALLKRISPEDESTMVRQVLADRTQRGDLVASSELAWVEVARALRRAEIDDVEGAVALACSGIARQKLDAEVLNRAHRMGPPSLRTVDAIHLAAAVVLGVSEMLTFDRRLAAAARCVGVHVIP